MTSSYMLFDDIEFYYEDDDNGGVPFVFLHGLGGSVEQTMTVIKKTEGIRRISIDFRGHGKTIHFGNPSKFSFKQFAEDVLELLKYLGLSRVHLGGISTGAGVSLYLVLNYPEIVDKLVISRPAWEAKPQTKMIQSAFGMIYEILNNHSINEKKEAYMGTDIYKQMNEISKYAGETLLGQFDYEYAEYTSEKLNRIPKDAPNFNREDWTNIKSDSLILVSQNDPIHPFKYGKLLKSFIPMSKLVEITPKDISVVQHNRDSYESIIRFLNE